MTKVGSEQQKKEKIQKKNLKRWAQHEKRSKTSKNTVSGDTLKETCQITVS